MSNKVKRLAAHKTMAQDATIRSAPLTCVGADDTTSLLGEIVFARRAEEAPRMWHGFVLTSSSSSALPRIVLSSA